MKKLPDYFICPMSHDIMLDPVILPSGYTFDRRPIQRWIDSGHRFCPITNLPLPDNYILVPNRVLRNLISNFTPTHSDSPSQLANSDPDSPSQLAPLVAELNSAATRDEKLDSLSRLGEELKSNPSLCREIPKSGAIRAILQCVNSDDSVIDSRVNSAAISLVVKLSREDDEIKIALAAEGAVAKLVAAIRADVAAASAASALTYLCCCPAISSTIGGYPGAIRTIISRLKHDNRKIRRSVATALFVICYLPENGRRTVECDVIPVLINSIRSGLNLSDRDEKEGRVDREVAVLSLLANCEEGREEILARDRDVVDILLRYLKKCGTHGDIDCVYYGVLLLDLMCRLSGSVKDLVKIKGGLGICLSLISGCDKKIGKVGLRLAKVLI